MSGERVSRSRTGCLGCHLVLAPGVSEGGGVGKEGESGPASRCCRVECMVGRGGPLMSPRSARPPRAVPVGQQGQEGKPEVQK